MGKINWYGCPEIGNLKNILDSKCFEIVSCLTKLSKDKDIKFYKLNDGNRTMYIKYMISMLSLTKPYRRAYSNRIFHSEKESEIKIYHEDILNRIPLLIGINDNEIEAFKNEFKMKIKSTEWLYDVHWYLEVGDDENKILEPSRTKPPEEQFCPSAFPLAIESEWGNDNKIKYDFQKLLFCNADMRLMIFKTKVKDKTELRESDLSKYFVNAIKIYPKENLSTGSKFLFAAFSSNSDDIYFGTYSK